MPGFRTIARRVNIGDIRFHPLIDAKRAAYAGGHPRSDGESRCRLDACCVDDQVGGDANPLIR